MEKRELICIGCPMGCPITVEMENGEVISLKGNTCAKGDVYARKEVTNPTRIVTSTILVRNGAKDRVSCKTATEIPKLKIFDVMTEVNRAAVTAPIKIGDVLIENVAGTGVSIIATSNVSA